MEIIRGGLSYLPTTYGSFRFVVHIVHIRWPNFQYFLENGLDSQTEHENIEQVRTDPPNSRRYVGCSV